MRRTRINILIGILVVAAVAALVYGAYLSFGGGNGADRNGSPDDGADANGDMNEDVPDGYRVYRNEELGFSILMPAGATAAAEGEGRVKLTFLGPGNEPDTEITDGFTLTVFREEDVSAASLQAYSQAVVADVRADSENTIVSGLEQRRISGMSAYRYSFRGALGAVVTEYIFLPRADTGYRLTYIASDPAARGYESIILTMLESVSFFGGSVADTPTVSSVRLAFLDTEMTTSGPERGCDRVVMVARSVAPTQAPLTAAMRELFSIEDERVSGYYNFIARTNDTLKFDRAVVTDGRADIYLTGRLSGLAGVCDNPRARIQIEETALQFGTVDSVRIFLNGELTDLTPSERG